MVEKKSYDLNEKLSYKLTYKYDDTGNKIEENYHNADGDIVYSNIIPITEYKYDIYGNLIEENRYRSHSTFISKTIHKYE